MQSANATQTMSNTPKTPDLPEVLQKTQEAKAQLEASALDLFVVNEVLKQEIPEPVKAVGDISDALERSESIKTNLDAITDDLEDVNNALVREVARRKVAEQKLSETKADLADTKAQLNEAKDQQ